MKLIRLQDYCHVLCCGGSGSGKGVSIVIPNLLTYRRGSVVCFDTKGDLYETAASRRHKQGDIVIRLAPFNGGTDALNPLDTISRDSSTLVDFAHAMAAALVVRQESETDPHWNDKAIQLIRAVLVLVLLRFEGKDRSLNSVQEIISDTELLRSAAEFLRQMGGIPARSGQPGQGTFQQRRVGTHQGRCWRCQYGDAAFGVSRFRDGGEGGVHQFLRSEIVVCTGHDAVHSNSAGATGCAEGAASLLGVHAGTSDRH
jgi:type IV secretion system protein VirD4